MLPCWWPQQCQPSLTEPRRPGTVAVRVQNRAFNIAFESLTAPKAARLLLPGSRAHCGKLQLS